MAEPKTVSNLPLDVSIRWSEDQKLLEETKPLISESLGISQVAEKDVSSPAIFSQVDLLLDIRGLRPSWALFAPPPGYYNQHRRIFTSRIAASCDADDQIEDKIQKLGAASEKEESKGSKKRETLIKMLQQLLALNKSLSFVITRRGQYQKG